MSGSKGALKVSSDYFFLLQEALLGKQSTKERISQNKLLIVSNDYHFELPFSFSLKMLEKIDIK